MFTLLDQLAAGQAPSLVPLNVEQYHRMIAEGILSEGAAIELIDGLLVHKDRADREGDTMSHGPRHAAAVRRLPQVFRVIEDRGFHLRSQLPVTLSSDQEPEPDLALVRGRPEDFEARHPGPQDVAAVMEVADSSLNFDRTTKQRLYARAEISVYWIVNLVDNQVEAYETPLAAEGRYACRTDYRPGQAMKLTLLNLMIEIAVVALLPGAATT